MGTNTLDGLFSAVGGGLCVAVDMRKNSVTCYICRSVSKDILAISSFDYTAEDISADEAQRELVAKINNAVSELCEEYAEDTNNIKEYIFVGSAEVQSRLCKIENKGDSLFGIEERARSLGLVGAQDAAAFISPCVSENIAGTIPAGLFLCNEDLADKAEVYIDFGERTCAVICKSGKYYAAVSETSVFGGHGISYGKNASSGVIYSAKILENGNIKYFTKNNVIASGICPTGLVDAVAVNLQKGKITSDGSIDGGKIELIDGVSVTEDDVKRFMRQRSAVFDSILFISQKSGISLDTIEKVTVSGSYGSQYSPDSLEKTGVLPKILFSAQFETIGNASGLGAIKALGGDEGRDRVLAIADKFMVDEKFSSENIYNL